MASMVIRSIPDDLMASVKEAARQEGKSAEQIAREARAEKMKPSREEIFRRMDAIRSRSKPVDPETMALAMLLREPLATADRRLVALAQKLSIETELIEPAL